MSSESKQEHNSVYCGFCPDEKCSAKLIFSYFETTIDCTQCGQWHNKSQIKDVKEVSGVNYTLQNVIQNLLLKSVLPKRGTETIKVLGLSNYYCKLISPLLTKYGMDKETGKAKRLSEMNQGDILDCGLFCDRAFLIDPEHITIPGFGRDLSGSMEYLSETLNLIKMFNKSEERLIPVHSDGDGHCLVHAISRALVGRELFWHPLRCSLKKHLEENLQAYQDIFKDFVEEDDWVSIIDECDPNFIPPEGELLGLRNIHVFGLANVLKRPIILLDTLQCMERLGDYSALFLPSMVDPNLCRGKDNHLNKPLCIAWSSSGHNHFIPLVGIKKKPLPVLPKNLLPKVWGVPQNQIFNYMEFDVNNYCIIGGDRSLADSYILRLVNSMEDLFYELHGIHPSVVADAHHFLSVNSGSALLSPMVIVHNMKTVVQEGRLYRCMTCDALIEQSILPASFKKSGVLYNLALRSNGSLLPDQIYSFPLHGLVCRYDSKKDELQPDLALSSLEKCSWCESMSVRKVRGDGSIVYKNKDQTKTRSITTLCSCGYKHYWEGREYDNLPQELPVTLEWNGKVIKDTVMWFQNESNLELNSNVFQVSSEVIQKHFPGEFGSERLVQRVVDQLLNQTKSPEATGGDFIPVSQSSALSGDNDPSPGKLIIGGKGVLHKEELGISETERKLLQKIETRASHQQKRQASETIEANSKAKAISPTEMSTSEIDISLTYPASLATSMPVTEKVVRIVTSDGRQSKLHLKEEGMTLKELQMWVNDEFQIPVPSQKIKCGFPPRELCSSSVGAESQILALAHGDRIIVEISKDLFSESIHHSDDFLPVENTDLLSSSIGNIQNSSDILKAFENLPRNDDLDAAILSVLLSANLCSLSAWEYSQKLPHLFSSNGLYYQKMKRDIGLVDKKHGRLPMFPEKVFCYNAEYDRLELCLEPNGHYPITEGVEENVYNTAGDQGLGSQHCSSISDSHSNAKDLNKIFCDQVAFQGTGYSLKEHKTNSQTFKTENRDTVSNAKPKITCPSPAPVLVRKGPGFSVLSQPDDGSGKSGLKRLQSLADQVVNGSLCQEVESYINDEGAGEPAFPSNNDNDSVRALDTSSISNSDLSPRYFNDNLISQLISPVVNSHEPVGKESGNQCIGEKCVFQESGCVDKLMKDQNTDKKKIVYSEMMDVDNS